MLERTKLMLTTTPLRPCRRPYRPRMQQQEITLPQCHTEPVTHILIYIIHTYTDTHTPHTYINTNIRGFFVPFIRISLNTYNIVVNEDGGWNGEAATDILLRGCVIAFPTFHAKIVESLVSASLLFLPSKLLHHSFLDSFTFH